MMAVPALTAVAATAIVTHVLVMSELHVMTVTAVLPEKPFSATAIVAVAQ
jgi:hypothetical protein